MIVKNILIGEDVRKEIGNKLSVMGIFGSALNIEIQQNILKDAPIVLSLACLISIENNNPANDPKDFNIQIFIFLGEKKLVNLNAKIESTGMDQIFHLPVPRFNLPITETTKLTVQVQVMKEDTLVSENTAFLNINLSR